MEGCAQNDCTVPDWLAGKAALPHWQRTTCGRRTFGINVPLQSVVTSRSVGMGDVGDLDCLIDFCRRAGAGMIQLLPVNDAGWDGMPYSALSAFALDPAFVALDAIEGLESDDTYARAVRNAAAAFRNDRQIDNVAVRTAKDGLLREAWNRLKADTGIIRDVEAFFQANPWLPAYAAFKVLRMENGYASWESWSTGVSADNAIRTVRSHPDFMFHGFCQMVLHRQFSTAHRRAAAAGILIEGDIPILVSRDSADVWEHPELFHLESAAGAPPDMYSEDGQHWGFPTYRWSAHAENGFAWWKGRLGYASNWFDCYRIDHVVGFFRIWTVDVSAKNGRDGRFVPADETVWGDHGRAILAMMLEATPMLPLAEDLGTIPPICRSTLRDMGICGLKVQRWERYWDGDGSFIEPSDYDPLSVATLSTHDCETFAGWWETASPAERESVWKMAGRSDECPSTLDSGSAAAVSSWFCREAGSSFVVLAMQDVLHPVGLLPGSPELHRINLPGTVGPSNWSWKCPVDLSELQWTPQMLEMMRELFPPA